MNPKNPESYFCVIPAIVLHSTISPQAKLLFGIISGLTNQKGYCYASNAYLGKILTVDPRTIRRLCTILKKAKFVDIVVLNKVSRRIYPQFTFRGRTKMS